MNNKMMIAVAVAAGLLGGLLSRYIDPASAFAQDQPTVTKEIRAQSFILVDPSGRAVGTFAAEPGPGSTRMYINPLDGRGATVLPGQMRIVLRDSGGREIWSAGADAKMLPLNSYR
jgi:hypothetical protein